MSVHTSSRHPVFIVGTGRCGSTILYSLLAMHPDFAWIPSHLDLAPSVPLVAATARIWNLPGTDRYRETRLFPKPVEPNRVFAHWIPDYYSETVDPPTIETARAKIVPLVERIMRYQGRVRFLGKLVGRPVKITLLRELFPAAKFVHITRGLNATVASLLRVDFYERTREPIERWRWDVMPPRFLEFYRRTGSAPEAAAAITITLNKWEIARQLERTPPDDQMEVAYHTLVEDPPRTLRAIGERSGFEVTDAFLARIERRRIYNRADEQWKRHLTAGQQRHLAEFEQVVRDVEQENAKNTSG